MNAFIFLEAFLYEEEALKYGEIVYQLVSRIMTEQAYRNVRKVQGLFRLAEKYGSEPLNLTCKRCLFYEDYQMDTIKRVLDRQFYLLPLEGDGVRKKGSRLLIIYALSNTLPTTKGEIIHEHKWSDREQIKGLEINRNASELRDKT